MPSKGPERLNAACERAWAFGDPAYRTVRNILHKALEAQESLPPEADLARPDALGAAYLHGPDQLFEVLANADERK